MDSQISPVLVAACGNVMAGDDAFGPLVAERLRARPLRGVEVVDLGMKPAGLLNHLDGRRALIVVDAAVAGPEFRVGSLIDMAFESPVRPALLRDASLSSHGLSLSHELQLATRLGMLPPRIWLIAAVAGDAAVGTAVSAKVLSMVQIAAQRVLSLAREWLATELEPCHS